MQQRANLEEEYHCIMMINVKIIHSFTVRSLKLKFISFDLPAVNVRTIFFKFFYHMATVDWL
jgi:hypothetical protein